MKTSITLFLLLAAVSNVSAGQTNSTSDAKCSDLRDEHRRAFEGTKYWGKKAFVSHPGLSSNEIASIKGFFLIGKTTPDEAFTWFRQQNLPVATNSYHGCVRGYTHTSFMRKVDADSWLLFLFSGNADGLEPFIRGERLRDVCLERKEKRRRWLEHIVSANTNYNEALFENGLPNEELLKDVDVKIETDL